MKQCINCNIDLKEQNTKPSQYCSDACRKAFKRKESGQENGQKITDTEKTDNVSQTDDIHTTPDSNGVYLKDIINMIAAENGSMNSTPLEEIEERQKEIRKLQGTYFVPNRFNGRN